jgi:sugar/nucleoside kinase (ribokinase family)
VCAGASLGPRPRARHYNRSVTKLKIDLAIVGRITIDTFVTSSDRVFASMLGGSAAYAAAGARVWSESLAIVARVGSGFPETHLRRLQEHGINVDGVIRLDMPLATETFFAYEDVLVRTNPNPASAFLRLGYPMPKSLVGYRQREEGDPVHDYPHWAPRPADVPSQLQDVKGAHLASSPYASQCAVVDSLQAMHVDKLSLDPDTAIMKRRDPDLIRNLVNGIGVFIASEKQARALFGPVAGDTWNLAEHLLKLGCRHVVIKRGPKGQCVLDGQTDERWLIPAYPSQVKDVTGAGHAYGGGFLAGWVETGSLVEAALAGAISASLAIEGSGPFYLIQTMPGLAEARRESLRQNVHRL